MKNNMLYTIRLLYLTLSIAVSNHANGLSIFNSTVLQPPLSSSTNFSASLEIPAESQCDNPEVKPLSTLAPDSYHCFIKGIFKLLYIEADFLNYLRPPQYSARDRLDLLSLLDTVYDIMNSRATSTHNDFLPAPTPPDPFSSLNFNQGGMTLATATFPCTGTIAPFHGFSKIMQVKYGDMLVLINKIKVLVQNKVDQEKNVAIVRIFGRRSHSRTPFALRRASMLGVLVWRSNQVEEILPQEMGIYRDFTCKEGGERTGEAVAVD